MKTTKYALLLPLCMLCVQCAAGTAQETKVQSPYKAGEDRQEMRTAALVVPPTFPVEPPDGATVTTRLNDAQIAGVLNEIVQSQLAQARVAGSKSGNYKVNELAAVIVTRRDAAAQDLAGHISMLQHSELLARVRADAQRVTSTMAGLTGVDFDMAYVAGQVREFSHDIILLDTRIIPDAQAPQLKRIATELRNAIAQNLTAAKALQNELIKNAGR